MSKLKDQILTLRSQGKTYDEIQLQLQCSKGTISYHCGSGQKEKTNHRQRKLRQKQHPYISKLETFTTPKKSKTKKISTLKNRRLLQLKIQTFHQSHGDRNMYNQTTFSINDVIDKFGENPTCYLTGQPIDIYQPRTYEFDHIIPRSRGGTNTLDNLGICSKQANQSKRDMTPDEFLNLCKQIIEHNGYTISKS